MENEEKKIKGTVRQSVKNIEIGSVVGPIEITVQSAELISKEIDGDVCILVLSDPVFRNVFQQGSGGSLKTDVKDVLLSIAKDGSVELVLNCGLRQRFPVSGLSKKDKVSIINASTEQLSTVISSRSDDDKARLAKLLIESLSEEERKNFVSDGVAKLKSASVQKGDKVLLVLLIDRSGSMFNGAWDDVSKSVESIALALKKFPDLAENCEIAVIGYGTKETVVIYNDFTPVSGFFLNEVPVSMGTYLYEAYKVAVELCVKRKESLLRDQACDVSSTWVFCLSDYQVTMPDIKNNRESALAAMQKATEWGISIFNFPCGPSPNLDVAFELSQEERPPVSLEDSDFVNRLFAKWVIKSVRISSMSQGQSVKLPRLKNIELRGN